MALAKRRQALEESKANRLKEASVITDEDDGALERILADLRNGDTVTRKARRRRPTAEPNTTVPLGLNLELSNSGNDMSMIARDMLARLKSDGFSAPPSPTTSRRRRRRTERPSESDKDIPTSPLASEILDMTEQPVPEHGDEEEGGQIILPS